MMPQISENAHTFPYRAHHYHICGLLPDISFLIDATTHDHLLVIVMSREGQVLVNTALTALLLCPKCKVPSTNLRIDPQYSWCLRVLCSGSCQDSDEWYVCRTCRSNSQRKRIKKRKHLTRHDTRFHSPPPPPELAAPLFHSVIQQPPTEEDPDDYWSPAPPPPVEDSSPEFATDLFLASLLLNLNLDEVDAQAPHPPNFASLFDNQLDIPPHMGVMNDKGVSKQRRRNVSYFEREHQSPGYGASGLVATATYGCSGQAEDSTPKETLFGLMNAWFLKSLRPQQREIYYALTDVTSSCPPSSTPGTLMGSPDLSKLLLPTSDKEAQRWILGGESAICDNVARPSVHRLRNGYSYISFSESLACLLAGGVKVEPFIGRQHPFVMAKEEQDEPPPLIRYNAATPRGMEIQAAAEACYGQDLMRADYRNAPVVILLVFLWSDGFEPSATKQNRGSVQAFLASVSFQQADPHSGATTLLLALGPSDSDTADVEFLFLQELAKLAQDSGDDNLYYWDDAKQVVRVFAQIYSVQQDRMERQKSVKILAGNSNSTGRWGWLGRLSCIEDSLPCCSLCLLGLLSNEDQSERRRESNCCACWTMEGLTHEPPPDYPVDLLSTVSPSLPFRKNSFESMAAACDLTFLKVSTGVWAKAPAGVFLNTEGVVVAYANMVVGAGLNKYEMGLLDEGSDDYEALLLWSRLPGTDYPVVQPEKPLTWQYPGVSLLEYIDVLMHLMFLGIVATVIRDTYFKWLKAHGKMTSLSTVTNRPLLMLQNMNIDWCKVQPILPSGTLSNSVSENFLAFARCGKWLFGCNSLLRGNDVVYSDPDILPHLYSVTQIRAWYHHREIKFVPPLNGPDIKALFYVAMAAPGGPPPIPEKGEAGIPKAVAEDLIESMACLAAHAMIGGEISEYDCLALDRHIKIFLSRYHAFDKPKRLKKAARPVPPGGRKSKTSAGWISHMNFISLLNLPDVLRRFGSLRPLWEGDRKGEGGLPKIKAKIKGGTKGDWAGSAATALLRDTGLQRAIKVAADSVGSECIDDPAFKHLADQARVVTGESNKTRYKNFLTYKDEDEAVQALHSGGPVSMVILEDGTVGMMLARDMHFVPVRVDYEVDSEVICGAAFLGFCCEPAVELVVPADKWGQEQREQRNAVAKKYVLLLPELKKHDADPFSRRHYFITSDWEEMNVDGNIVRYQLTNANY
jgi:hypothetical protein